MAYPICANAYAARGARSMHTYMIERSDDTGELLCNVTADYGDAR